MILAKISILEIVIYILLGVAFVTWTTLTIVKFFKDKKKPKTEDPDNEEEDN